MKNLSLLFICFFTQLCFSQNLRSVADWESVFKKNWDKEFRIANKQSTSNDSWQFYNLAYSIDANTTMFQATGNTIYLDRALLYINNMINSTIQSSKIKKSQYKDNYLGWANHSAPAQGDDGKEYPLFESFCWRYVSSLLYIIKQSPSLINDKVYGENYNKILNFTIVNIYEKWASRGMNNLYRSNTHMTSHWARIAMDLYLITGEIKYKKITDDFVEKFQNQIQTQLKGVNKNAITWKMSWEGKSKTNQDTGHGNGVVGAVIDIYEKKMGFTKQEINSLITTFDKVIWKTNNTFADSFDGAGKGTGWFTDGLIKLGRFDENLQKRIESHNKGRSTQFFGNGALNACILINGSPVFPKM